MQQFDLYKKRGFGDYISDTITFLRTYGRHFFGNYFKINGWILIFLSAIIFLLSKSFIYNSLVNLEAATNGMGSPTDNQEWDVIVPGVILMMLLLTFLSLISVTYTVIYLGLIEKHRTNDFTSKDIVSGLKNVMGRMLIFFFASLLTVIPIAFVFMILFYVKEMAILLLPVFFILGPAFLSWVSVSYFTFILEKQGFFQSLGRGFEVVRYRFWPIVGSTLIISFIVQILQSAVTLIPYIVGVIVFFTTIQDDAPSETFGFISIGLSTIFVISVFAGYFLNNLLVVNQGLIYYTAQENDYNNAAQLEIDNIGSGIE
ncbi:hypothetical protein HYN48_14655 [Flavobacterium magnum]|uniref:Glycerophosphoryl diester phosphodiesterase membrane domain-containing protein n=1 Tax=Flavobacterium magnum TaxID=2162713 RepID=A0A2S0RHT9_9FLAO|nr:hypothetical protein [Flavobacterium magnum]AWA31236.1 hypothetical protein HYN48_14655 [Flavobacterium magnum]